MVVQQVVLQDDGLARERAAGGDGQVGLEGDVECVIAAAWVGSGGDDESVGGVGVGMGERRGEQYLQGAGVVIRREQEVRRGQGEIAAAAADAGLNLADGEDFALLVGLVGGKHLCGTVVGVAGEKVAGGRDLVLGVVLGFLHAEGSATAAASGFGEVAGGVGGGLHLCR